MTELEPVAWKWEDKTGAEWLCGDRDDAQQAAAIVGAVAVPLVTLSSAQSAIAERDARIAELEAAVKREAELATHMASDCNDAQAHAEALEALLKEAGQVLGPFSDFVKQEERNFPDTFHPENDHKEINNASFDDLPLRGWFRAARSLASKIGVGNE